MEPEKILSLVKSLIQTLEDGKKGFAEAAESSEDVEVRNVLSGFSRRRAELSAQMQTVGASFGDSAYDQGGSLTGALHRGWINLKTAIASRKAHAVLQECEHGEDHAVADFQNALKEDLPENLRQVVEVQFAEIKAAHDQVKKLRDLAKAAHV